MMQMQLFTNMGCYNGDSSDDDGGDYTRFYRHFGM
jgi:hypothetical protein